MPEPDAAVPRPPTNPLTLDPERLRPWKELERDALGCTRCRLSESRTRVVFGGGDRTADLMLIGEAPGRNEDLTGKPFAGATGNVLDTFLAEAGLDRDDVFVTDLVMCRPPKQRTPRPDEIERCLPYLVEQIAHVRPRVIVAFGELVTSVLMRRHVPLERIAGYRLDIFDGVTLIPTYRPTHAVKGSALALTALKRDMVTAKAVLDGRLPTGAELAEEARARREADEA